MSLDELLNNQKLPQRAVIREAECIGCTKCIQACPIDAIIGASKQMHTVIADACIGCELCVAPCPVDCIDLIPRSVEDAVEPSVFIKQSHVRYQRRQNRLAREQQQQRTLHEAGKLKRANQTQTLSARQAAIQESVQRVRNKHTIKN